MSQHILTVSELNNQINNLVESRLPQIIVKGEISGLKPPPHGHMYFNIKDYLKKIGIKKGDTIVLASSILNLSIIHKNLKKTFLPNEIINQIQSLVVGINIQENLSSSR